LEAAASGVGSDGVCGGGAVGVHDAELPAGGSVDCGTKGGRVHGDGEWKAGEVVGLSRESGGAEFLGIVLRVLRGGDSGFGPVAAADCGARGRGVGRERG